MVKCIVYMLNWSCLEMGRNCCNCRHNYHQEYCSLFDELIEENCSCWMWSDGEE